MLYKLLCLLLQKQLELEGYKVITAAGGESAIALARRERPDLVLLDLMMPDIDGLAALRILRLRHSAADLPVVVVTAETASAVLAEAFRRGLATQARDIMGGDVSFTVEQRRFTPAERAAFANRGDDAFVARATAMASSRCTSATRTSSRRRRCSRR